MKEDDLLKGASSWQRTTKQTDSRLGDELFSYFQQRAGTFEQNSMIVDAWQQVVPAFLQDYCRLDKRIGNTLYVQVLAGPYMHQVQMVCSEWIEQIRQRCPRCGLTKIKIVPMRDFDK